MIKKKEKKEIYLDKITGEKLTKETDRDGDVFYTNSKNQRHRIDGPALERLDGYKAWFKNDRRHRTDGPACEYPLGYKSWFQNDKRHRTDGPAIECANGYKAWWINGKEYTELGFNIYVRKEKLKIL